MFFFRKCQEAVQHETTKGSLFIGYRILQYEQHGCSIIKSMSDFFNIVMGCLDIHI